MRWPNPAQSSAANKPTAVTGPSAVTPSPDRLRAPRRSVAGDVADLDNLLGFAGNMMIFPLKRDNALTSFLTAPYYDPFTGLQDPDVLKAMDALQKKFETKYKKYVVTTNSIAYVAKDANRKLNGNAPQYERILAK